MKVLTARAKSGKSNTQSYYNRHALKAGRGPRNAQFGPPAPFGYLSGKFAEQKRV